MQLAQTLIRCPCDYPCCCCDRNLTFDHRISYFLLIVPANGRSPPLGFSIATIPARVQPVTVSPFVEATDQKPQLCFSNTLQSTSITRRRKYLAGRTTTVFLDEMMIAARTATVALSCRILDLAATANPLVSYLPRAPRRDEVLGPRVPGGRISGPNRGRADNHRVRLKDLMPSRRIFGVSVRRRVMTLRCRCLGSGPGWRTLGPKVGTEFAVSAVETNCVSASRHELYITQPSQNITIGGLRKCASR